MAAMHLGLIPGLAKTCSKIPLEFKREEWDPSRAH